ncbi:lysophospholipid acyltransferase family protein [Dechloromonas sp. HYN0024]|uniref:lysophospholipid acyltransferase family protein n=1 Tax=Dechloromonas sp. HYN0024 TaxID=2231055 RepID=UPI000E44603A|nr:lysophospholipid acyltransferase family protein [Dechloromonas sp. HYN0024]AXS78732.1 lysophospholipid acyltransferase family protein [Dechloromonas sp. HYN0024]
MVFIFRLLSLLPLRLLHALGSGLGRLTYWLSPTYRRHLQENIAQAGLPSTLRGRVAAETGKQMVELARIWMRPLEEAIPLVAEVVGWEHVEAAQQAGKGIVFLTPHLGCFEITAQYLSSFGDITVLYRAPKSAVAQELILTGRKRAQLHLAPADLSGVRALIKALKKGQMVGMLPDQAPKTGEGVWLKFFGRYAYTMTLAARLTETGAASLLTWGERLPGGRGYRVHFELPQKPLAGSTVERAQQINGEIETLIRQCPTQYLWGYNRYKRPTGAEPAPVE